MVTTAKRVLAVLNKINGYQTEAECFQTKPLTRQRACGDSINDMRIAMVVARVVCVMCA